MMSVWKWRAFGTAALLCAACDPSGVIGAYQWPPDAEPELPSEVRLEDPSSVSITGDDGGTILDAGGSPGVDARASDASPGDSSDAKPRDSSTPDGGVELSQDAGDADAGALVPSCSMPSALFCDGFEAAGIAPWSYSVELAGTLMKTTARSYEGAASLAARTTDSSANVAARYGRSLGQAVTQGDLWFRARYFLPTSSVIPSYLSIASISRLNAPYEGMHVVVSSNDVGLEDGIRLVRKPGSIPQPRDTWVCIEAHLIIDPVAGLFEVFVDGASSTYVDNATSVPDGYALLEVGIHYAPPLQGSPELYVDDVVLARTRVGCL